MKKLLFLIFILVITNISIVLGSTTLFETSETKKVTKGVTIEIVKQVTDIGLRDVYILKAPLNDPNITMGVAESKTEYGLKETVTKLLTDNNAVAGVNGDFFGMAGAYSLSFGPVVKDSKFVSVTAGINTTANENASFYIDNENNPFILYMRAEIDFFNDGKENMEVLSVNKITDMIRPVIITRAAMINTKDIDARFSNLLKIVVTDNRINYISKKGETVNIPENGFVVAMGEEAANNFAKYYWVGQTASYTVRSGIDLSKIKASIGGASRILLDGKLVSDGSYAKGRHPRTAIGISKDKQQIILMLVDGRTHSVGATHEEMAELLLKYGAYNAMHLDGGGSSTMVAKFPSDTKLNVLNTLSDGSQRRVINAFGIYNNAPIGEMKKLILSSGERDIIYKNVPIKINAYTIDDYYNRIDIPRNEVILNTNDSGGRFEGDYFYPSKLGKINFIASFRDIFTEYNFECRELIELRANYKSIKAVEGDRFPLRISGIDSFGEENAIPSGVAYEVLPATLGSMEDNTFIASGSGAGLIKCSAGQISTYIPVQIGGRDVVVHQFEGDKAISFASFPETVTGSVLNSNTQKADGNFSMKLTYQMPKSESTQAAYLVFDKPFLIEGDPIGIKLSVYGNNSNLWLRGKVRDAEGVEFSIDFTKKIDFTGFKKVQAAIPENFKYPLTLEKIYLASLSNPDYISGEIYIDSLTAVYPLNLANVAIPETPKFAEPLKVNLSDKLAEGSFDITVIGKMDAEKKPKDFDSIKNKMIANVKKNTKLGLYIANNDMPTDIGVDILKWKNSYLYHNYNNVSILQMTAANGGFIKSNPWQWASFSKDIASGNKDYVIITMDKNPLNFSEPKEFELFHSELAKIRANGKMVFVVSADGYKTTETLKNGVRYINLANLFKEDSSLNNEFRILRFRINGSDIRYDLQKY